MPDVNFYVLPSTRDASRLGLIVKLVEKAYEAKEPTYLYFTDRHFMELVDKSIWNASETAFIPHTIIESYEDINEFDFIYLSLNVWAVPSYSLLINLSQHIPDNVEQYKRVFEIITQSPEDIEQSRQRFREYRTKGFTIKTHKL